MAFFVDSLSIGSATIVNISNIHRSLCPTQKVAYNHSFVLKRKNHWKSYLTCKTKIDMYIYITRRFGRFIFAFVPQLLSLLLFDFQDTKAQSSLILLLTQDLQDD